jgi:hypothetical protein
MSMEKWLIRVLARPLIAAMTLAIVACDNAVTARNPLMAGPGYGDFVMLAEGYTIPDTVKMNDTVDVPFRVGGGVHPCSFLGPMWIWQSRVFYLAAWGKRPRSESCRATAFRLWGPNPGEPQVDSVRWNTVYYGKNPAVIYRVIVCRPDGSYDRKDMVVRVPWPTSGRIVQNEDSLRRVDARECRGIVNMRTTG